MNPEFYEDEVYEGFYVPAMLKKAWGAQMDVLAETDAICRRHDIPYFADWGTLLATIRHRGYIPWDDDLDISMRRCDYDRFITYAEKELPEGFKVMNFKNHPGHHFFVSRIVGKPRICFEEDHLRRFHGFPYICGIDLFILDNVCSDRKKEELKAKKAEYVITVADNIADGKTTGKEAQEQLKQCEIYTGKRIDRSLSGEDLRIRLYTVAEELFASIPDSESDALVQMMPYGMYGNKRYIPKEFYRKTVRLPYMDTQMSVPLCYDTVMRYKFGNYMEVHKSCTGHDYPFYYGQHEQLLAVLDFEYPHYKAGRADIVREKTGKRSADVDRDINEIKDIVFIPFASKHWKYMEKLYRHYMDEGKYIVHVIPVPYFYKEWDTSPGEMVFDPEGYPGDLNIEDWEKTDLATMHPEKIVIQFPYDEWNPSITVPAKFYSSLIRRYTDELIYIPFFVTDDFTKQDEREYVNMDHYVCMPGVINADTVILPSEVLKETYMEKIMEFAGCCDQEMRSALDVKIVADPGMVYSEEEDISDCNEKNSVKKIVYFSTVSLLAERGKDAIKKIRDTIEIFKEHSQNVKVIWIVQCEDSIELAGKDIADDFQKAVQIFKDADIGDYAGDIPVAEYDKYIRSCDAYYGQPSSLAFGFVRAGKPVMIENADVIRG